MGVKMYPCYFLVRAGLYCRLSQYCEISAFINPSNLKWSHYLMLKWFMIELSEGILFIIKLVGFIWYRSLLIRGMTSTDYHFISVGCCFFLWGSYVFTHFLHSSRLFVYWLEYLWWHGTYLCFLCIIHTDAIRANEQDAMTNRVVACSSLITVLLLSLSRLGFGRAIRGENGNSDGASEQRAVIDVFTFKYGANSSLVPAKQYSLNGVFAGAGRTANSSGYLRQVCNWVNWQRYSIIQSRTLSRTTSRTTVIRVWFENYLLVLTQSLGNFVRN